MEGRGGGREGKGRRGAKGYGKGREGKDNGDRPPTIFGLKVALWCAVTKVCDSE